MAEPLSVPVEDPILVFGIATFVFLAAPLLLRRYRLPGMVGIILVGAAIGDNGIGLLERGETIVLLGEVGLVYLMFIAGLEINVAQLLEQKDRSIVFGSLSFLVPQLIGTAVGYAVLGLSLPAAALFASIFASHTLLAYPVVDTLGITDNESVTSTIGGTIITDTLALLVLAVVIASTEGELDAAFWLELAIGLGLFFVGVWVLVPKIAGWFFSTVDRESYFEFLFVMSILFLSAFLAELAGVEPIVGAFLAGLVLNRIVPERGTLLNRIEFVGNALFIPFFLLSVGMLIDVGILLEGARTLTITAALVVLVMTTKYASSWLTGRLYGYSSAETMTMFGLSVGQAAAALAIVLIGADAGLFGEPMLNAVVLMILVVSVVSPTVVDRYGRRIARATPLEERTDVKRTPRPETSRRPDRVLVSLTDVDDRTRTELLEFALAIRDPDSREPLYTLRIVRPGSDVEYDVEATERSLAELESSEESAERAHAGVPLSNRTRVDRDVASGIAHAALENRISTLVLGWDGTTRRRGQFDAVTDRILARTNRLAFVSRLRSSIRTTEEIVLLIPTGLVHNVGFVEAIEAIDRVGERLEAPIRVCWIGDETSREEHRTDELEANLGIERERRSAERVDDWDGALETVSGDSADGRLLVALCGRRDEVGWEPSLESVPEKVSTRADGNVVVTYPAGRDRVDDRQFFRFD